MVARRQLLELGMSAKSIDRRIASGRLHLLWRGVYAVGRPRLTLRGWWSAAVLACGDRAVLSHISAGHLWGIRRINIGNEGERERPPRIHISIPASVNRQHPGIQVHRRRKLQRSDRTWHEGIPVTTAVRTLIDLATILGHGQLEAAVNEADKLDLTDPARLRGEVSRRAGLDGAPALRKLLDRRTFRLTDSELERRFMRLVRRVALPSPLTQQRVNGFRVDFYWPDLRLVVETDGLRYHRTATQQSRDRIRDQAHAAAGFIALRFTHAQVKFESEHVVETLRSVADRVSKGLPPQPGAKPARSA